MPNPLNVARNQIATLVQSCTGTGAAFSVVFQKVFEPVASPGQLQVALANVGGTFSSLQFNLEYTPTMSSPNWEVVGTWTPLTNGVSYFPISEAGFYRFNCTAFAGGTTVDVLGTVGLPSGASGTGSGPASDVTIVGSSVTLPVSVTGQPIAVTSEGNVPTYAVGTPFVDVTGTTFVPVLSVQPQSGSQATTFSLQVADLGGIGTLARYQLVRNATLTGSSFSAVGSPSLMNYDTSATSSSGGVVVDEGSLAFTREKAYSTLEFNFSGSTGDIFTLTFASLNSGTVQVAAAFRWTES